MKYLLILIFILCNLTVFGYNPDKKVKILNYEGLKPYLNKNNDTTYVINFWATWCAPCIEELPAFGKLHDNYNDKKLKIILVSLDFKNQIDNKLLPFIKKNKIKPEVIVLDDSRSNYWIDAIDKSWSGAIPATIIYKGKSRDFYEKSFSYDDLENIVKQKLE